MKTSMSTSVPLRPFLAVAVLSTLLFALPCSGAITILQSSGSGAIGWEAEVPEILRNAGLR